MLQGIPRTLWLATRSEYFRCKRFGANSFEVTLDALVVVLQSPLNALQTNAVPLVALPPYPTDLRSLKTDLYMTKRGLAVAPPFLRLRLDLSSSLRTCYQFVSVPLQLFNCCCLRWGHCINFGPEAPLLNTSGPLFMQCISGKVECRKPSFREYVL